MRGEIDGKGFFIDKIMASAGTTWIISLSYISCIIIDIRLGAIYKHK